MNEQNGVTVTAWGLLVLIMGICVFGDFPGLGAVLILVGIIFMSWTSDLKPWLKWRIKKLLK